MQERQRVASVDCETGHPLYQAHDAFPFQRLPAHLYPVRGVETSAYLIPVSPLSLILPLQDGMFAWISK